MADEGSHSERPRRSRLEVTGRRDDADFRRAHRHGGLVRVLRWAIPAVVAVSATGFAGALYFAPPATVDTGLAKVDLSSNSLVMEAPRVSGFMNSKRSYEVSAKKATQDLTNPRIVTLENIDATLGLDTAGTATIGAKKGIYDSEAETLKLREGIRVETSAGYRADLKEADINLRTNTLRSSEPLEIKLTDGTIRGNAVEISDNGRRIHFTNGVSMTIGGAAGPAPAPAEK